MPLVLKLFLIFLLIMTVNANLLSIYFDEKTKYKNKLEDEPTLIFLLMMFFSFLFISFPNLMKKIRTIIGKREEMHTFGMTENVIAIVNKKGLIIGKNYTVVHFFPSIRKCLIGDSINSTESYPAKYFVKGKYYRALKLKRIMKKVR